MDLDNLIIIEDDEKNSQDARDALGREVRIVSTFMDFQKEMKKGYVKGVLSDLYFPLGDFPHPGLLEIYKGIAIEYIDSYVKDSSKYNPDSPITKAVEQLRKIGIGNTHEEVVDFLQTSDQAMPERFYDQIREVVGVDQRTLEYKALREQISNDDHLLPLGIFVYQQSLEDEIPCIIVTSEYHHGAKFQPFISSVGRYFDQLKDGEKMWSTAFKELK